MVKHVDSEAVYLFLTSVSIILKLVKSYGGGPTPASPRPSPSTSSSCGCYLRLEIMRLDIMTGSYIQMLVLSFQTASHTPHTYYCTFGTHAYDIYMMLMNLFQQCHELLLSSLRLLQATERQARSPRPFRYPSAWRWRSGRTPRGCRHC